MQQGFTDQKMKVRHQKIYLALQFFKEIEIPQVRNNQAETSLTKQQRRVHKQN